MGNSTIGSEEGVEVINGNYVVTVAGRTQTFYGGIHEVEEFLAKIGRGDLLPSEPTSDRAYTNGELDLLERGLEEMARNEHPSVRFKYNSPLSALRAIRQLRAQAASQATEHTEANSSGQIVKARER